jgi:hypothetical protein
MYSYFIQLIEKCGLTEIEIERILKYSNKMYNYISDNLFLNDLMNELSEKIGNLKRIKEIIRKSFLINAASNIKKGIKKKNLTEVINFIKNVKQLKEILDVLRVLVNNPQKLLMAFDLVQKGKNILKNYNGKVRVLKGFEEEYDSFNLKISDKILNEFNKNILDDLKKMISFEITNEESNYVRFNLINSYRSKCIISIWDYLKI